MKKTIIRKKRKISDAEFDAALYKALEQYHYEKKGLLPPEEELPPEPPKPQPQEPPRSHDPRMHYFSEEFNDKIMKIFDDYQDQFIPNTRNLIKKSWVLAASFFIVLCITVNAGASRFTRTRFAIGNHPDHSEVNYEVPDMALAPKEILEYREPEWGEEYEEIKRVEGKASTVVRVSKKNSDIQISFSQLILSFGERYLNTEYVNAEKILLELKNGKVAFSIIDSNEPLLFWNDGEYYYELQGNCEIKDLIQLANQLRTP